MGYTTDFEGEFMIDRPVDDQAYALLRMLATKRRMRHDVSKLPHESECPWPDFGWGLDGEFYGCPDVGERGFTECEKVPGWDQFGFAGQAKMASILDYNSPPRTQPGLWCHWLIGDDRQTLEWDGGEKFYRYAEWLDYLIKRVLEPRGYKVNGEVEWFGEDRADVGKIVVVDNVVTVLEGRIVYGRSEEVENTCEGADHD